MAIQSKLENWGFKRVEETSASTVHLIDQNEGTTDEVQRLRHGGQSHHEIVSLNKAKRLWGNFSITTYNVESLSDDRIRNLINQMTTHRTKVMLIQGTRSKWNHDRTEGNYKIFFEPSGSDGAEQYAGVAVIVSLEILHKARVNKIQILEHRALGIRVKTQHMDIMFIAAYAPGDHLPRATRQHFWSTLSTEIRKAPRRTVIIVGTDANGHVGRDPSGGIGPANPEYWSENGLQLQELTEDCRLTAVNTLASCKDPGWTWQKRDGTTKGRIDYILLTSNRVSQIDVNQGSEQWPEIHKQGTAIDHRPVTVSLKLKTIQEMGLSPKGTAQGGTPQMTPFNETLVKAYVNYMNSVDNQFRQSDLPVDSESKKVVDCIQLEAKNQVQLWDTGSMDADSLWQHIHNLGEELYFTHFKSAPGPKKRKEFITDETMAMITKRNEAWFKIRRVMAHSSIPNWEGTLQGVMRGNQEGGDNPFFFTDEVKSTWTEWDSSRKKARDMVRKDRTNFRERIITEIGNPDGEDNVWKAIDRLAPKRRRNVVATLKKENGQWCYDEDEELTEVKKFASEELKQSPVGGPRPNKPTLASIHPTSEAPVIGPSTADVIRAIRKTKPGKVTPGWAVPHRLWVLLENQIAKPMGKLWRKIGEENRVPESWVKQKVVWIPKPKKNANLAKHRRGITLLDSGAKVYYSWLQRRMSSHMQPKWRSDSYGAIPGRGVGHALTKVLGVRSTLQKAKVPSASFLGDAIKAFDRVRRSKCMNKCLAKLSSTPAEKELANRLVVRHQEIIAVTEVGNSRLEMQVDEGVAQGDPLGPPVYVVGYEGTLEKIDEIRIPSEDYSLPFQLPNAQETTDMSRTLFVDDHFEIHVLDCGNDPDQIKQRVKDIVEPIFFAQSEWGIDSGRDKTVILLSLFGRGSQKARKVIGNKILLSDGSFVRVVIKATYLGVEIGGPQDGAQQEVSHRIRKANEAMNRLSPIWRLPPLSLQKKIHLYNSLVLSILTYAAEFRQWSTAQLERLEAVHMRHLRRIARSPAHVDHESNSNLRERIGVPSLTSQLRFRRLKWFRKLLTNPDEPTWTGAWGSFVHPSRESPTPVIPLMQEALKSDLGALASVSNWSIPSLTNQISQEWWDALKLTTIAQLSKVLSSDSLVEKNLRKKYGPDNLPTFECSDCGRKFVTKAKLQTHRSSAHAWREPLRKLVRPTTTDEYSCRLCNTLFKNKQGAQLHVQRVCAPKHDPAVVQAALNAVLNE